MQWSTTFLVFKFWAGEQLAYMMPVGRGDLKAILRELIEDADKENQHNSVCWECAAICALISKLSYPEQFTFTENRDYADLYLFEK